MNIGRFNDVYFAESKEGIYNINELGMYFETTADEALQERIDKALCSMGYKEEELAVKHYSVRIASFHTGRIYSRYAYLLLEGLPTLLDREWVRTTAPIDLTEAEVVSIATLAVRSFIEAMDEAYSC